MFPINKQFITPDELRAQAASLEASAKGFGARGLVGTVADMLTSAKNRRARASAMEIETAAQYLEDMRAKRRPSTTADPYGDSPIAA